MLLHSLPTPGEGILFEELEIVKTNKTYHQTILILSASVSPLLSVCLSVVLPHLVVVDDIKKPETFINPGRGSRKNMGSKTKKTWERRQKKKTKTKKVAGT